MAYKVKIICISTTAFLELRFSLSAQHVTHMEGVPKRVDILIFQKNILFFEKCGPFYFIMENRHVWYIISDKWLPQPCWQTFTPLTKFSMICWHNCGLFSVNFASNCILQLWKCRWIIDIHFIGISENSKDRKSNGVKSHDLDGRFTSPKREKTRPENFMCNNFIVSPAVRQVAPSFSAQHIFVLKQPISTICDKITSCSSHSHTYLTEWYSNKADICNTFPGNRCFIFAFD